MGGNLGAFVDGKGLQGLPGRSRCLLHTLTLQVFRETPLGQAYKECLQWFRDLPVSNMGLHLGFGQLGPGLAFEPGEIWMEGTASWSRGPWLGPPVPRPVHSPHAETAGGSGQWPQLRRESSPWCCCFCRGQERHGEEGGGIEISHAGAWMYLPTAGFYNPADFPGPCCSLQSSFAWFRTLLH